MDPMNDQWIPDLTSRSGVKYAAIADAIETAVEQGTLRAGERLPPQRELALKLGVDLTTITKAYDAARRRGFIEARGRAGSFVRDAQAVQVADLGKVEASMNMPPELAGGLLGRAINEATSALLSTGSSLRLQYQSAGGAPHDRAAGAGLLSRSGLPADPEQILVTAGGQNALHAILSAAVQPGDAIACGEYVYPGFRSLAERFGLRLVTLPDLDPDAFRDTCRSEEIKALYVVPTNDNPTTRTLSPELRRAIAATAEDEGIQVIEDDAYGALSVTPSEPIASLIPHRTWYVSSTSKIISPALRVAFVRAPSLIAALRLGADLHETAIMAPPLNVAIVGQWLIDGTYDRLLDCMRTEAKHRQAIAQDALQGLDFASHPQGYHLWLQLAPSIRPRDLADLMRPTGLSVMAAEQFAAVGGSANAVRVALGGPANHDQLRRGLDILHGYATAPRLRAAALI